MTTLSLIAEALGPGEPPEPPEDGVCCVTGRRGLTVARRHGIKPSFTNLDLLRAPNSDRIGVDAWRVLTYFTPAAEGKKRGGQPLMQSSWLVTETGITYLSRLQAREHVLSGVSAKQWAGYITTSYKKHGALRAPLNTGGAQRWLFEMDVVDCADRERVAQWWYWLRTARAAGIPRPVIESLDVSLPLLRKHQALWREFEPWARARYRSALYRLLTYLLPGKEELNGQQD